MISESTIQSHHLSAILTTTDAILRLSNVELLNLMKAIVREAGLNAVGQATATFEPQGISAVLLLEESHVALHIWTESQKVAVDIHVCDYHQDNLPKARKLADLLTQKISQDRDRSRWNYLGTSG